MQETFTLNIFNVKMVVENLKLNLLQKDKKKLESQCKNKPKLRVYNQIANFSDKKIYLSKPLSFIQRKAIAKLRLGVLPIRIETGRYERPKRSALERTCKQCDLNVPENEIHFLLHCPKHVHIRQLFSQKIILEDFFNLNDVDKLKYLVNHPEIVKSTTQFIINCFDNRVIE